MPRHKFLFLFLSATHRSLISMFVLAALISATMVVAAAGSRTRKPIEDLHQSSIVEDNINFIKNMNTRKYSHSEWNHFTESDQALLHYIARKLIKKMSLKNDFFSYLERSLAPQRNNDHAVPSNKERPTDGLQYLVNADFDSLLRRFRDDTSHLHNHSVQMGLAKNGLLVGTAEAKQNFVFLRRKLFERFEIYRHSLLFFSKELSGIAGLYQFSDLQTKDTRVAWTQLSHIQKSKIDELVGYQVAILNAIAKPKILRGIEGRNFHKIDPISAELLEKESRSLVSSFESALENDQINLSNAESRSLVANFRTEIDRAMRNVPYRQVSGFETSVDDFSTASGKIKVQLTTSSIRVADLLIDAYLTKTGKPSIKNYSNRDQIYKELTQQIAYAQFLSASNNSKIHTHERMKWARPFMGMLSGVAVDVFLTTYGQYENIGPMILVGTLAGAALQAYYHSQVQKYQLGTSAPWLTDHFLQLKYFSISHKQNIDLFWNLVAYYIELRWHQLAIGQGGLPRELENLTRKLDSAYFKKYQNDPRSDAIVSKQKKDAPAAAFAKALSWLSTQSPANQIQPPTALAKNECLKVLRWQ